MIVIICIYIYYIYIIYILYKRVSRSFWKPSPPRAKRPECTYPPWLAMTMAGAPTIAIDRAWSNYSGGIACSLLFARVEISSNKIYFLNTYLPPPPAKTHFHLKFWSSNNSNFSTGFFQLFGRGEPTFLRGGGYNFKTGV